MTHEQIPQAVTAAEQTTSHEIVTLNTLREYRLSSIESAATASVVRGLEAENSLERHIFESQDWDRVSEYGTPATDTNLGSATERRLLAAIGQTQGFSGDDLLKKAQSLEVNEKISLAVGNGVAFVIDKYADSKNRVSYQINVDKSVPKEEREDAIMSFHTEVRKNTQKLDIANKDIKKSIIGGEKEAYSNEVFTFDKNADDIITHLTQSHLANTFTSYAHEKMSPAMSRRAIIETLYSLPAHYAGEVQEEGVYRAKEGLHFDENGQLDKVLIGTHRPGVYIALKAAEKTTQDLSEQPLQIGIEMDTREMYTELDYNGIFREETLPFLETPTAQNVLYGFDEQGIKLNDRLSDSFAEVGRIERRYGHGYSEITREIAKIVNDKDRSYNSMFEEGDAIVDKVRNLADVTDPAAKYIIEMLKDTVDRKEAQADMISLPVSANRVELRDGGCKDAEVYVADSTQVSSSEDGTPLFLNSTYKRKSVITLQPTLLNGVRIPAGALLAVEDDGYLLMRLTGYSFSPETAAIVFGAQDAENRQNSSSYNYRSQYADRMIRR